MPVFVVRCRTDAFIDYVAEVEAHTPEQAAKLANDGHSTYQWQRDGEAEFDARLYVALDADGNEIDSTQRGDF